MYYVSKNIEPPRPMRIGPIIVMRLKKRMNR